MGPMTKSSVSGYAGVWDVGGWYGWVNQGGSEGWGMKEKWPESEEGKDWK
jgi:hypothetical protein